MLIISWGTVSQCRVITSVSLHYTNAWVFASEHSWTFPSTIAHKSPWLTIVIRELSFITGRGGRLFRCRDMWWHDIGMRNLCHDKTLSWQEVACFFVVTKNSCPDKDSSFFYRQCVIIMSNPITNWSESSNIVMWPHHETSLVPKRISRLCKDFEKLHCPYLVYEVSSQWFNQCKSLRMWWVDRLSELHIQNFHVIKDLKRSTKWKIKCWGTCLKCKYLLYLLF